MSNTLEFLFWKTVNVESNKVYYKGINKKNSKVLQRCFKSTSFGKAENAESNKV